MKRLWSDDDLVAHFTLLPQDRELLQNKTGPTRLGFAVLFKCFQQEGRFPAKHEIPFTVVRHLAEQIEMDAELFVQYPAEGRTVEYHRAQIREALGFHPITDPEIEAILSWMDHHILPQERDPEALTTRFYTRCRDLHLEPPAAKRLSRLIHSAIRTHEEAFCTATFERLTPVARTALEALLQPPTQSETVEIAEGDAENTQETTGQALFYHLKAGPGGMQLKTVLDEIARLRRLRALGLPADLFSSVPPKILQRYRLRVAAEEAHELRRHPKPLRLTLLAVWSYLRVQEITDN